MDCVLNNLVEVWVDTLNTLYDKHVKVEDIIEYEVCKAYPDLDKEAVYNPLSLSATWHNLEPTKGSVKGLKEIIDYGYDVYIATATHFSSVKPKVEWLLKHFPYLTYKQVITIHNKSLLLSDYIIDDCYDNLVNHDGNRLCYDQPWNRQYNDTEHNIVRVRGWDDITHLLIQE